MRRLIKNLVVHNGNIRYPRNNVFTANWDLAFNKCEASEWEELWYIILKYENSVRVANTSHVSEELIKGNLIKLLSRQIYGDADLLLDHLIKSLIRKQYDDAMDMALELKKEIGGAA